MCKEGHLQHIDEQALNWLLKQHEPQYQNDARSQSAFRAWLTIDPEHQAAFLRWKLEWEAMDAISEEQVSRLRTRLQQEAMSRVQRPRPLRLLNRGVDAWFINPAWRFALGGALCLLLGVALLGTVGSYFV